MNIIEKMIGGVALSDLRGKGTSFRPFEKIIELEKVAEEKFSTSRANVSKKIKKYGR